MKPDLGLRPRFLSRIFARHAGAPTPSGTQCVESDLVPAQAEMNSAFAPSRLRGTQYRGNLEPPYCKF